MQTAFNICIGRIPYFLELEKQQIIDAYNQGTKSCLRADTPFADGNLYYNETFNQTKQ